MAATVAPSAQLCPPWLYTTTAIAPDAATIAAAVAARTAAAVGVTAPALTLEAVSAVYAATATLADAAADTVLGAAPRVTRRRVHALQPPIHARHVHGPDARQLEMPQRHTTAAAAAAAIAV